MWRCALFPAAAVSVSSPQLLIATPPEMTMRKISDADYETFDPAIVDLCRAVNEFPDIQTSDSCQGFVDDHREGEPWSVYFAPRPSPPTPAGYASIEFLVYLCGRPARDDGFDVRVRVNAPPPLLNGPGQCLYFIIEGIKRHPNEFAAFVRERGDFRILPATQTMMKNSRPTERTARLRGRRACAQRLRRLEAYQWTVRDVSSPRRCPSGYGGRPRNPSIARRSST